MLEAEVKTGNCKSIPTITTKGTEESLCTEEAAQPDRPFDGKGSAFSRPQNKTKPRYEQESSEC